MSNDATIAAAREVILQAKRLCAELEARSRRNRDLLSQMVQLREARRQGGSAETSSAGRRTA